MKIHKLIITKESYGQTTTHKMVREGIFEEMVFYLTLNDETVAGIARPWQECLMQREEQVQKT